MARTKTANPVNTENGPEQYGLADPGLEPAETVATANAQSEGAVTALEGSVVEGQLPQTVQPGAFPAMPPAGVMSPPAPGGWTPQAWLAAQQALLHWQQTGQVPQGWQGMPPQGWQGMPQGMPPQGWPGMPPGGMPQGWQGIPPQGMMAPPGWQGMPPVMPPGWQAMPSQGMMSPQAFGQGADGQGQPVQGGGWTGQAGQSFPGQIPQAAPYGWQMPPINVVVQNSQTNPQVVQQPQASPAPGAAPAGSQGSFAQAPVIQNTVVQTFVAEPGQEVLVRTHVRTRMKAVLLSFLFGWVGAQRFYLGQQWRGLLLLLLMVTPIPIFLGIWDGLRFLFMSDDEFDRLFNYSRMKTNPLLSSELPTD